MQRNLRRMSEMKIRVTIEVPDGEWCSSCSHSWGDECDIFGETVAFVDTGREIKTYKHPQCRAAEVKEDE